MVLENQSSTFCFVGPGTGIGIAVEQLLCAE